MLVFTCQDSNQRKNSNIARKSIQLAHFILTAQIIFQPSLQLGFDVLFEGVRKDSFEEGTTRATPMK